MDKPLKVLDLFAGIGGFSYAAEQLVGGFETTQFVEWNKHCHKVLAKHWPGVPIHSDIKTFHAREGEFDVITGGFPCQDLSSAGKQLGFEGERSSLFYEIMRIAREVRPSFILFENVGNLVSHLNGETFQEVLFQIAKAGYDAEWAVIPASDLGACHQRKRVWIVAWNTQGELAQKQSDRFTQHLAPCSGSRSQLSEPRDSVCEDAANTLCDGQHPQPYAWLSVEASRSSWTTGTRPLSPDWRRYVSKPVLCRGDDGLSGRVERFRQLGNAVVPQVAAVPLARIKRLWQENNQK